MRKVQVYRIITITLIVASFVIGYYRHGNIADAAFKGMISAFVVLTGSAVLYGGDALVRRLLRKEKRDE